MHAPTTTLTLLYNVTCVLTVQARHVPSSQQAQMLGNDVPQCALLQGCVGANQTQFFLGSLVAGGPPHLCMTQCFHSISDAMLRAAPGLPQSASAACAAFAPSYAATAARKACYDHTIQKGPALIRTRKSTWIGLHQYWGERSPGNPQCRSVPFYPFRTPSRATAGQTERGQAKKGCGEGR